MPAVYRPADRRRRPDRHGQVRAEVHARPRLPLITDWCWTSARARGHYLAAMLDQLDHHAGLALDAGEVRGTGWPPGPIRGPRRRCADVWRRLPVADGAADLVLDVFAPAQRTGVPPGAAGPGDA